MVGVTGLIINQSYITNGRLSAAFVSTWGFSVLVIGIFSSMGLRSLVTPVKWIAYLMFWVQLVASQFYPGSYELNTPTVSESGSSETGHCSDVSDSGRVCNAPRSSVLFDGIPTLTGLEGNMWASHLLTLNTSTSSASITFNFTNPTDRNGPTNYAGVSVIEVVMFNCPARGIGAGSIGVNVADNSIDNIAVSESCEYLVRACSNDVSTLAREVTLNFINQLQRVYLAEVTFYTNSRPCSPIGPINTSVITTPATTTVVATPVTKPATIREYNSDSTTETSNESSAPVKSQPESSVTTMHTAVASSKEGNAVITGIVSFLGGIVLGFSVASIAYLIHWLYYKKRKAQNRDITTELSSTRETTVEVPENRLPPVYDEIGSIEPPNTIEMQQNSAYASSRSDP